ncbi:FAD/NAD(P)-binding domain-containing protein [Peniophora sp. CONT]|nr:FAD/NAD(P)-binding domain-containing protein [Peniophora sp. CONT]
MSKKSVVVVGGGGAGHAVARALSTQLDFATTDLTLLTARPFYTHLPALVRLTTTAVGKLEEKALVPYDHLFPSGKGTVKVGRVTAIEAKDKGGELVLEDGERVSYDVLVLAPGSHWQGPLELPDDREAALASIAAIRSKIESAKAVVLAGGGAVGAEYAGELKDFYPDKKVTIVHAGKKLLNDTYPDKYRAKVEKDLRARKVELVLGDYVENLEQTGPVKTRSGKEIDADLIIPSVGGRPATEFIASLGADALNERGQVRVKPTLQLQGHADIFAAGDAIEWDEQKMMAKYPKHADVVVANVVSYLKNGSASRSYAGQSELIVLTNGVKGGSAYFGVGWGIVLGAWMASRVKSKELFIPQIRKGLGVPA